MKRFLTALLLTLAFSVSAYTGDELLIDCGWYINVSENQGTTGSIGKSLSAGRCQGFISGLLQSYNQYIRNRQLQQNIFCLNSNTDTTELANIILKHLEATENIEQQSAAALAIDALANAYACSE